MFNRQIIHILRLRQSIHFSLALQSQKISYFSTQSQISIAKSAVCKEDLTENSDAVTKKISFSTKKPLSQKLSEREFLVRLKNDPDSFGTEVEEVIDAGDLKEEKHFTEQPLPSRKLTTKQYADMIKDLIKHRKIKEAIDLVEIRMIKEDRVKPENYIYNLLLGACGRVGYTKKAFSLYNSMKKRGLKITPGTYTALFNACSNSPWKGDGLTRATHLRNLMIEKMYEPNVTNYNAMIKAFGRGGDLNTAFALVDEMVSRGITIKDDTINFLLQACISDAEAGFHHALLVWNKLVTMKINPSVYTYNLMLRCIRDCGIGDINITKDVIKKLTGSEVEDSTQLPFPNSCTLLSSAVTDSHEIRQVSSNSHENPINSQECPDNRDSSANEIPTEIQSSKIGTSNLSMVDTPHNDIYEDLRPNLIANVPHLGSIISLSEVSKPEDRLILVGGLKGFLQNMEDHDCKPDIKTFTQLLDTIPSSIAMEKQLIDYMKEANVKPDLDFYNMLIKKRSMRFDYEGGKDVLKLIKKSGYKPDLITYGVLSLSCKTKEEALELIQEMQEKKYRLNAEILGSMLHQATHNMNFPYVIEIMEILLKEDIEANKKFMECLADFYKKTKYISNDKNNKLYYSKKFRKEYNTFRKRYKTYLQEIKVDSSEDAHPWQQFRQNTGTERYKDKNARFKPVRKSLFRVTTSPRYETNNDSTISKKLSASVGIKD